MDPRLPVASSGIEAGVPSPASTVLVVDDDPPVRQALATLLRDVGYRVIEAADRMEAASAAGAHAPDLLVLEPGPSFGPGLRGLDQVRAACPSEPMVLVLTTRADAEHRSQALRAGCSDVLEKPCGPSTLLSTIAATLTASPCADRATPIASA